MNVPQSIGDDDTNYENTNGFEDGRVLNFKIDKLGLKTKQRQIIRADSKYFLFRDREQKT